jgi:hypothetical protein
MDDIRSAASIVRIVPPVLLMALALASAGAAAEPEPLDVDNALICVTLEGFFPGEAKGVVKRLNCYLNRRNGSWISGIGTPTFQGRPQWNTALMLIDPAGLTASRTALAGTMRVTLIADPWVPADQKTREAVVTITAAFARSQEQGVQAAMTGSWSATIPGEPGELSQAGLLPSASGTVSGTVKPAILPDLSEASYDLAIYDLMPAGHSEEPFHRRRALSLGVKAGEMVSARIGQMDLRHSAYDYETIDAPTQVTLTPDTMSASVRFSTTTLDGGLAQFAISLSGTRLANWAAGRWTGTCTRDGGAPQAISGFFRGDVRPTAFVAGAGITDVRPWFVPVPGHVPFLPGEHPRLFFRTTDLPELRRRAATADGQAIILRLRRILDGGMGDGLPIAYNPATKAYSDNHFKANDGTYTISHAAGYGFLFQLTGERRYADLARQCVEKAFAGQRDQDDRYAWVAPGGELRAGPSIGWTAVAYDLCYEGWDASFRMTVARAIQDYQDERGGEWNNHEGITLRKMMLTPKQGPGSNHFGAVIGGCGLAVLAISDDPGTDPALLATYRSMIERQVVRQLSAGWGDGGYYKEGWGASMVGTQGGFLCCLQALRTALGHDYANAERPNASFITMVPRCLMMLGPPAALPYRSSMGGTYGSADFAHARSGFSWGGHFAEGFGAIADRYLPALLWTYDRNVDPSEHKDFDLLSPYPHRAMLALINWPTFRGITECDPALAMPRATRDHLYEYMAFRDHWRDADDIITTVIIDPPKDTKPRDVMVWGMSGLRLSLGEPPHGAHVTAYAAGRDGSGTMAAGEFALAVDYSGASGADALIVVRGSSVAWPGDVPKAKFTSLPSGTTTYQVLTLSRTGTHPQPRLDRDALVVGGQTVTWSQGAFHLATFAPVP